MDLPDFQLEAAVFADELEVGAVGRDEAGAVGADGEGDQHVEVEIAELARFEASFGIDFCEELAGLEPVVGCGGEGGVVSFEGFENFLIIERGGSTP